MTVLQSQNFNFNYTIIAGVNKLYSIFKLNKNSMRKNYYTKSFQITSNTKTVEGRKILNKFVKFKLKYFDLRSEHTHTHTQFSLA